MAWNISPYMNLDNRRYGIVNLDTGDIIIQAQYTSMGYFRCGLAVVHKDFDMGYIDTSGKIRIPFKKYQSGEDFIMGYAVVKNWESKYGVINTLDDTIVPFEYDKIDINEKNFPYINCYNNEKEIKVDIHKCSKEIILDGLHYHKSYKVSQFKELLKCQNLEIVVSPNTKEYFFRCGMSVGISAINIKMTTWQKVIISLVTNVNGRTFWLLHSMSQIGESYINKEKYGAQNDENEFTLDGFFNYMNNEADDNYDYYENDYNGWSSQDIESGLADAFEDDPDALLDID